MDKNKVKITMEDGGEIVVVLDEKKRAPFGGEFQSAGGEKVLRRFDFSPRNRRLYDSGGETPREQAAAAPKKNIKGEFYANGVKNNLSHRRGVISMARANDFDSASSQFFICHKDATFLDGQYAAFGIAESGLDVVDRIAAVPTDANDRPKKEQKIKYIRFAD